MEGSHGDIVVTICAHGPGGWLYVPVTPDEPASPTAPVAGRRNRRPTEVDRIADEYFEKAVAMSPLALTGLGRPERQDEYDDFSPAGLGLFDELNRETLARLAAATPQDLTDKVTVAAMRERLGLEVAMAEANLHLLSLNGVASGLHAIREVYDQMPTGTGEDWRTIAARLRAVPTAVVTWFISQQASVEAGVLPARRQVELLAEQVDQWVAPGGFFDSFRDAACLDDGPLPDDLARELAGAVEIARRAYTRAADKLRRDFLPVATVTDGVGEERYRLFSRTYVGAEVDLAETYRWGLAEVARLEAEEQAVAERIRPGATIAEAIEVLDGDERYRLHGTEALQRWMQQQADEAIERLDGTTFDIDERVRTIECCIAPTHDGGIYYTGPSEDFSRPGRMWWSVPDGVDSFSTWRERTTVYHEGVPGHHLQISLAQLQHEALNSWRRTGCWVSGHGEGWALYAEYLMAELGFQDDPGDRLGMLDGQMLRAVRVVLDIGLHCGYEAPELVGGGTWDFDKAWQYFNHYVFMDEGFARYEVNRYAGWPGQAPSYKLGERLWLQLRDQVRQAKGEAFDAKRFHTDALNLGSLPLSVLQAAVLDMEGI